MKPVVIRLYAVLVALTLVGLLAWVAADWYQLQQKAQEQGRATLRQAAGWISELTIRKIPLDASSLGKVFATSTGGGRWKMLLLSSERGTEFYKGPRPPVPVSQAVPRWEAKALTEVKVTLPVFRAQGDPLILEGITEFYGRLEVFALLKACGLTLVVLLILTSVVVFLSSRTRSEDESEPQEASPSVENDEAMTLDEDTSEETIGTIPVDSDDEYWFDDNLTMEDLPPLDDPVAADKPVEAQAPVADEGPSLFSPTTGLGWSSFLATRLDAELDRTSSQNQDLSLVLLSLKGGSVAPAAWGQAVAAAFPFRDLSFEFEDGAAVVLPGRSLEQALKAARAFVEEADRRWPEATVYAGVAARAGRLLSSDTLLGEASSARRRSLAGTVRVLGLKTDPDRYREYLASASA